jgi:hypothetical protein
MLPPSLVVPSDTRRAIDPLFPLVAASVFTLMEPLSPALAFPECMSISPLTPVKPASLVATDKDPLDVGTLLPDRRSIEPPDDIAVVSPATIDPTVIPIIPAFPPAAWPVNT